MPLNDLLKLIEQAFKLRDLRFYLRELRLRSLADQYLLSKQPSQLGFLPPEGVNDIDRGLCQASRPMLCAKDTLIEWETRGGKARSREFQGGEISSKGRALRPYGFAGERP